MNVVFKDKFVAKIDWKGDFKLLEYLYSFNTGEVFLVFNLILITAENKRKYLLNAVNKYRYRRIK